jgi:hypothetical protein
MSQVKVFGSREQLNPIKQRLSDVIHSCVVDALQYPLDKRIHRFFPLDALTFVTQPIDPIATQLSSSAYLRDAVLTQRSS